MSNGKDCLIYAMPKDIHAYAVGWALQRLGTTPAYFYTSDLPDRAAVRLSGGGGTKLELSLQCATGWDTPSDTWRTPDEFKSVWFRRSRRPILRDTLGEGDRRVAAADWGLLLPSIELILEREVPLCVNRPSFRTYRNLKCLHLYLAQTVGLRTPYSLISNDPPQLGEFISSSETAGEECIAKPLSMPSWQGSDESMFVFTTTLLTQDSLEGADVRSDPLILQHRIPKLFEARVTKIGAEYITVKIDSQASSADSALDFRLSEDWRELGHEIIEMPCNVMTQLDSLCTELGMTFCTCDFIIDHDGEWTFLEINHMGNWLWVDLFNPETRLLDRMAQFLASGDPEFRYDPKAKSKVNFLEFYEDFDRRKEEIAQKEALVHADFLGDMTFVDA